MLSGWIVAVPEYTVGLTGPKVAKAMVKEWFGFGIPTRITTDQGPQFANAWWRTMCGFLGITHVYTQPYHHQANGRAERAGQQILEILRKINSDHKINWVIALPRVLRLIHDTPGEAGLSPYEIVFGRQRFVANVPYKPRRECEDAQLFFERMKDTDEYVAKLLNSLHKAQADSVNKKRRELKAIPIGTLVWYRRPPGTGGKLDGRWLGPCEVLGREGEHSYVLRTDQNKRVKAHRTYIKEYWDDTQAIPKPMFWHKRTVPLGQEEPSGFVVDKMLGHQVDEDGEHTFLVQKRGQEEDEAEFIDAKDFLSHNAQELLSYCHSKGLSSILDSVPQET